MAVVPRRRRDKCGLATERQLGIQSPHRIACVLPRTEYRIGDMQSRLIRSPTGARTRDQVVGPLILEDGRRLPMLAEYHDIVFGDGLIVIRELGQTHVVAISGRVDDVRTSVIVLVYRHIAGHVAVRTEALDEPVGTGDHVANRYCRSSSPISLPLQFEMKPQDIFASFLVEEHLGPLDHAPACNIRTRMIGIYCKRQTEILPRI